MHEGASSGGRTPDGENSSSSSLSSNSGHRKGRHRHQQAGVCGRSASQQRRKEESDLPAVPRSQSYSGRTGISIWLRIMTLVYYYTVDFIGMEESMNGIRAGPSSGRHGNRHRPVNDMDTVSVCSTCSSSSSEEDEDYSSYQLPSARRAAYGGVRISYVPNDAMALASARQRSQTLQSSSGSSMRHNSGAGMDKEKDKNCIIS